MTQMTTFFAIEIGNYDLPNKYLGQINKSVLSHFAWSSQCQPINTYYANFLIVMQKKTLTGSATNELMISVVKDLT